MKQLIKLFGCPDFFPYWQDLRSFVLTLNINEEKVVQILADHLPWMPDQTYPEKDLQELATTQRSLDTDRIVTSSCSDEGQLH